MQYKPNNLEKLSFYPNALVWLERLYEDSVNGYFIDREKGKLPYQSYRNKLSAYGYIDSSCEDNDKIDLEFIYTLTSYYEEYLELLVDLNYVDESNKDSVFSTISNIRKISFSRADCGYTCALDKNFIINFNSGAIRNISSDYRLKKAAFRPLNSALLKPFASQLKDFYLENMDDYDLNDEFGQNSAELVQKGVTSFIISLSLFMEDYIAGNGKEQKKPDSYFSSLNENIKNIKFSDEGKIAAYMIGKTLYAEDDSYSSIMFKTSKFLMTEDSFHNFFDIYNKTNNDENLFKLFAYLGYIDIYNVRYPFHDEKFNLRKTGIINFTNICNGMTKSNSRSKR